MRNPRYRCYTDFRYFGPLQWQDGEAGVNPRRSFHSHENSSQVARGGQNSNQMVDTCCNGEYLIWFQRAPINGGGHVQHGKRSIANYCSG